MKQIKTRLILILAGQTAKKKFQPNKKKGIAQERETEKGVERDTEITNAPKTHDNLHILIILKTQLKKKKVVQPKDRLNLKRRMVVVVIV